MALALRRSCQASCSMPMSMPRGLWPVGRAKVPVVCQAMKQAPSRDLFRHRVAGLLAISSAAALAFTALPLDALAVSGGGGVSESLAGKDLSGKDLRKFKLTKANLRRTNFTDANLEGVSLFGSLSEGAIFRGANLRNADLESGNYEDADFTNAVLEGAFVNNAQFIKVTITGSDWTDVVLRKDVLKELCTIADGVNPTTGVSTRESLLCP
ncbi:hypothetical protein Vafri_10692 [Volvox africanus]|uniref:Uncharacterized protein n=1 Tax=Volvox africanus TaxID=51714 RepID=A0A8J4B6F1_9CHLO|nr:hypothetical protein Vafri_10692 [Volvox africanus]